MVSVGVPVPPSEEAEDFWEHYRDNEESVAPWLTEMLIAKLDASQEQASDVVYPA